MTTIVEIVTPFDSIAFYPTPDMGGFVYDNKTLDEWYSQAQADPQAPKRPNAHGTYSPGTVFLKEKNPIIAGQYYGIDRVDALQARARLSAIFNEGESVVMRVTDELGSTSREVWLLERDAPFTHDFTHFKFDLAFLAPDPRRYWPAVTLETGLPAPSSGLTWPLGSLPRFFDWGTPGNLGQVAFTNDGDATTFPIIEVEGGFLGGFRLTEVETGRELTTVRPTSVSDVITFNSRTGRATISNGGGDITGTLTSRKWFSVPAKTTRRYQITPLGGVVGTPMMTFYAASASL